MIVRYLPVHRPLLRLSAEELARRSGVHPALLRRFVALGLLRANRDAEGRLWFPPSQLAAVARVERLRSGLSLNYAAIGLVIELLDHIRALEDELRTRPSAGQGRGDAGRSA
jgi:DNA-binding transcriptional MerR regulator